MYSHPGDAPKGSRVSLLLNDLWGCRGLTAALRELWQPICLKGCYVCRGLLPCPRTPPYIGCSVRFPMSPWDKLLSFQCPRGLSCQVSNAPVGQSVVFSMPLWAKQRLLRFPPEIADGLSKARGPVCQRKRLTGSWAPLSAPRTPPTPSLASIWVWLGPVSG